MTEALIIENHCYMCKYKYNNRGSRRQFVSITENDSKNINTTEYEIEQSNNYVSSGEEEGI